MANASSSTLDTELVFSSGAAANLCFPELDRDLDSLASAWLVDPSSAHQSGHTLPALGDDEFLPSTDAPNVNEDGSTQDVIFIDATKPILDRVNRTSALSATIRVNGSNQQASVDNKNTDDDDDDDDDADDADDDDDDDDDDESDAMDDNDDIVTANDVPGNGARSSESQSSGQGTRARKKSVKRRAPGAGRTKSISDPDVSLSDMNKAVSTICSGFSDEKTPLATAKAIARKRGNNTHTRRCRKKVNDKFQELLSILPPPEDPKENPIKHKAQILAYSIQRIREISARNQYLELMLAMSSKDALHKWIDRVVRDASSLATALEPFMELLCTTRSWKYAELWEPVENRRTARMAIADSSYENSSRNDPCYATSVGYHENLPFGSRRPHCGSSVIDAASTVSAGMHGTRQNSVQHSDLVSTDAASGPACSGSRCNAGRKDKKTKNVNSRRCKGAGSLGKPAAVPTAIPSSTSSSEECDDLTSFSQWMPSSWKDHPIDISVTCGPPPRLCYVSSSMPNSLEESLTQKLSLYRENSKRYSFEPRSGVPGRVFLTRRPEWLPWLTDPIAFPRSPHAQRYDVRLTFAVPVIIRNKVRMVVEFYDTECRDYDPEVLNVASDIASLIGRAYYARHESGQRCCDAF